MLHHWPSKPDTNCPVDGWVSISSIYLWSTYTKCQFAGNHFSSVQWTHTWRLNQTFFLSNCWDFLFLVKTPQEEKSHVLDESNSSSSIARNNRTRDIPEISRSVWLFKESRFATNCETSHSYIVIGRNPTSTRDRPTVQKASRAVNSIVPKNQ